MPTFLSEAWAWLIAYVDASWVDILSLAGGVVYAARRKRRCIPPQPWISKAMGLDVANGVSLVPLALLVVGMLSTRVLGELMHANRLILAVAGIVALLAILEEPKP